MLLFNENVRASRAKTVAGKTAPDESSNASEASSLRRVALFMCPAGEFDREALLGMARYNREHRRWLTLYCPTVDDPKALSRLSGWNPDGVIVSCIRSDLERALQKTGLPVVQIGSRGTDSPAFPQIAVNRNQILSLAVEHLRERGLRNVGFVGLDIPANQPDQERQFFFPGGKSRAHSWEREQLRLMQWLRSLPRPLGVVAGDDEHGLHVLEACRRAVLPVPDGIAVIGIGNDVLTCELSIPSLTSVDLNAAGIGFEAAALLDGMLDGRQAARETRYIAPRGVIVRQSTDVQACEDEDVGRAMRFIQQKACQGLQVMDVLAHLGTSRASLQKRMKALLGRTIHQEIQRIRLTRARELLAAGDMTIKQVARESGFASVQYMTRVFRAATGETPAQYRSLRSR